MGTSYERVYGNFKNYWWKRAKYNKEDYLQVREIGIDPKSGKPGVQELEDLVHLFKLEQRWWREPKFVAIPDNLIWIQ